MSSVRLTFWWEFYVCCFSGRPGFRSRILRSLFVVLSLIAFGDLTLLAQALRSGAEDSTISASLAGTPSSSETANLDKVDHPVLPDAPLPPDPASESSSRSSSFNVTPTGMSATHPVNPQRIEPKGRLH